MATTPKVSYVNVEQMVIPGSDPVAYQYRVKSLCDRTTPIVGTVLDQAAVDALIADTTTHVNVVV